MMTDYCIEEEEVLKGKRSGIEKTSSRPRAKGVRGRKVAGRFLGRLGSLAHRPTATGVLLSSQVGSGSQSEELVTLEDRKRSNVFARAHSET
jgi:hypothetical protein